MKEPGKTFADLVVWQKSHRPVFAVYRLTQAFPHSDTGLSLSTSPRRCS
jgi:hypothetical protein